MTDETKPKFTPGPWNTATVIRNGEIFAAVIDGHRERLCTMPDFGAAAQANAVLMSHAPEMYALLDRIRGRLESCKLEQSIDVETEREIRQLLAKTRGEEGK